MIPLMMQQDYAPKGWRKFQFRVCCFIVIPNVYRQIHKTRENVSTVGLMMGTRLWYAMWTRTRTMISLLIVGWTAYSGRSVNEGRYWCRGSATVERERTGADSHRLRHWHQFPL